MLFDSEISPVKILSIMLLIFMTTIFAGNINHHLIEQVNSNKLLKHILIIATVFILITLINPNTDMLEVIIYTALIYILYILSNKMNIKIVYVFLALLLITYIYEYYQNKNKDLIMRDVNIIDKIERIEKMKKNNKFIYLGLLIIAIIGSLFYENKKITQKGGDYRLDRFLFN
jgi:hypothetical protein